MARHRSRRGATRLASDHRYAYGRDMLFDEAQALLAIEHPGVPTLVDFVEDSEGAHLVHEFIEGAHLDLALQHLARATPTRRCATARSR